ncbi:hypothetical protein BD309DRAFT_959516 [Dichomitus squalens]|uniref:Uncharacterized protein n=1 Tax=Dichomitus squalens TaxID=114155 RepID=A0A4Q9MN62_9APHY|nr:hypothetical protein BD311DRAFT_326894 [Dichomitus squalens]TBU43927.1 hypothetical protein BD309DRAFT_959516 [Dichomitus squalens]TBU53722.1 hypothetical protein BD310DRAFT_937421 [Dichomitus squalens]
MVVIVDFGTITSGQWPLYTWGLAKSKPNHCPRQCASTLARKATLRDPESAQQYRPLYASKTLRCGTRGATCARVENGHVRRPVGAKHSWELHSGARLHRLRTARACATLPSSLRRTARYSGAPSRGTRASSRASDFDRPPHPDVRAGKPA